MPIRFGMLGMWHSHANGIVREIAAHRQEFRLVGCYEAEADVAADRSRRWGELLPEVHVFDTPEELLRQELDAVIVEGRVHDNLRYARMALESGRPVMLEKPAGTDQREFEEIIDLCQRKHLHCQMIYLFRYMSAVEEMLRLARKGELGDVYFFRARLPKDLDDYDRFVDELKLYPGGIFFEMAGHVIDMMVAILGKPKEVTPLLGHHHRDKPGDFVDNGIAAFQFDHAWGVIEAPILEVAPHSRRIEVFGTEGACVIPHLGSGHLPNKNIQPIEVYRQGDDGWKTIELPAKTLHISDLREFIAVVSGLKAPDYDFEHDLNVQEALLRASRMI